MTDKRTPDQTHERVTNMIEDLEAEGDLGPNHALFNLLADAKEDEPAAPGEVPAELRSWYTPFSGYRPIDITPPELRPEGLPASVAEGWAEPYERWQDVPIEVMLDRIKNATVPFELLANTAPANPAGRTGRTGRNLGKWGENAAADPIVVSVPDSPNRRVLLIQRRDIGQWAIPGGMVDPGETAPAALVRELREETNVDLAHHTPVILTRTYVDDWRNTDHAWVASTVALYTLGGDVAIQAGDDAADARWWPFRDLDQLAAAVEPAGGLYAAHRPLLSAALDHLTGR